MNGHGKLVHRLALESKLGRPIHPGLWALHLEGCPKSCHEPEHLLEGTPSQNAISAWEAGKMKRGCPVPGAFELSLRLWEAGLTQKEASLALGLNRGWLKLKLLRRGRAQARANGQG